MQDTSNIGVTSCTITSDTVTMALSVTALFSNFKVEVGNFKNPNSDTPISSITTTLTSSDGTVRGVFNSTVLINIQPDKMLAASITPGSF